MESANIGIPCGRCLGCKTARSQEWAARVMHETRDHESSIFATLTYAPAHLPADGQLLPRDLTLFLKRLRQAAALGNPAITGNRLRYLACGEYGDLEGRPHYHAILFGLAFNDARQATEKLRTSPVLQSIWGKGFVNYGEVTHASAAYVAGYTVKKIGETHCDADGVVKEAPFLRCSTKPGIGANYARRYASDFRSGALVVDGRAGRLPRYYKKVLERTDAGLHEEAAHAAHQTQCERFRRDPVGFTKERLAAAELIAARHQQLTRSHSL